MINKLYSFRELLDRGLQADDANEASQSIGKILIPRIQRSYAQGRPEEDQVRDSILAEMFSAMTDGKEAVFSFIYGSLQQAHKKGRAFELLDGQQRLTTLFLLHTYIYIKEGRTDLARAMKERFSYETRTTSHEFINRLLELDSISDVDHAPSAIIKERLWYSNAYRVDATVQAMLVMLDAIDARYKAAGRHDLTDRLDLLRFYVLPLEKFGLTEELYIKMNARGLHLTPFENFKADLVGYYKPTTGNLEQLTDWLDFATKLDTDWIDIFWHRDDESDKTFNDKFFRFFYRLGALMVLTRVNPDAFSKGYKATSDSETLFPFFDITSERQSDDDGRYAGFAPYLALIAAGIDLKHVATRLLDAFHAHAKEIHDALIPCWKGERALLFDGKKEYTRTTAILFSAIVEYILGHDTFDTLNFRRWMHMAWNIIENTNIDGIVPQVSLIQALKEIARADVSANDIFTTLVNYPPTQREAKAIDEERRKARLILSDPAFEQELRVMESHEFFKGFADVVLEADINILKRRISRLLPLFDKNGIVADNHLLIRAIVSAIRGWEPGLFWLSVTEKRDSDSHIKALLRRDDVKQMLRRVLDGADDVAAMLQAEIDDALAHAGYFRNDGIDKTRMTQAWRRLLTDTSVWDWIGDNTTAAKAIVIKDTDGYPMAHLSRSWYTKFYLTGRRHGLAPRFLAYGFSYENSEEADSLAKYGDYFDDNVVLIGRVGTLDTRLIFDYRDQLTVQFCNLGPGQAATMAVNHSGATPDEEERTVTLAPFTPSRSSINRLRRRLFRQQKELAKQVDNQPK